MQLLPDGSIAPHQILERHYNDFGGLPNPNLPSASYLKNNIK
jgi:hypothetical protein